VTIVSRAPARLGPLVVVAVVLATALFLVGTASAHAELVSSSPANQAILDESPAEILLTFTEGVDPIVDSIRLVDATGAEVALGDVGQSGGDDTLDAAVPESLDDGTYVVGWQAVSADSHKIRGAFTFSVGEPSPTAPGVVDGIFDASATERSESLLLGTGRLLSFAAIAVLLGAFFLAATITPELIGSVRLAWLLGFASVIAVVGTVWMLTAQAHLLTGSYFSVGDVIDTQSGRWWMARIVAVAIFSLLIPMRTFLTPPAGRLLLAVSGVGVVTVVAAGGHAITGDHRLVGLGVTMVHLAAMSLWVGGLVLLVVGVPRAWFWWTASQFSPWALGSVVALALTGSVNAWRQLGSLDELTDSSYGRWLVIKLFLVAVVVAVASFSRRMSRSDPEDEPAGEPADEPTGDLDDHDAGVPDGEHAVGPDDGTVGASRAGGATLLGVAPVRASAPQEPPPALRWTVVFEIVGMVLILMATAGLVDSPPPAATAATTQSASAVLGDRVVQVELEPAVTGGTEMHVYLTSPGGGLDQADEISVAAYLPAADLGPIVLDTVPAGPNHVIGPDVDLPVAGLWSFDVAARFGEFDQIVFTVQIPVTD
jgi:copper transport protein